MKYAQLVITFIALFQVGCGNGFTAASGSSSFFQAAIPNLSVTAAAPSLSDPNVMPLQVGCGYDDEPCVTVTVCKPGTSTCVSIPNVMVDTGSSGLRIFGSLLSSLSLQGVSSGSGLLAECISYLGAPSDWGPVGMADVMLGTEKASNIRIQVINSSYASVPTTGCDSPIDTPTNAGYNGIIGVSNFTADCGLSCANSAQNQTYYSCSGTTCTNIAIPEASQVSNPVAGLTADNNGVALQLPNVSALGSNLVSGFLVFGIGTRANNTPIGATVLTIDGQGNFTTLFNGSTYSGFIDSGSNGLYFPGPANMTTCDSSTDVAGFYCPSANVNFLASQVGANGVAAGAAFQIGNAQALMDTSFVVFNNVGAPDNNEFDWGLPFFLGKTIYVGLDNSSSPLASGSYWAY